MYLHENKELFEQAVLNASEQYGIAAGIVEKDYYITIVLKELVKRMPNLIFKGGTSLSKCFSLINRFSEDIDLTLQTDIHPTEGERKQVKKAIVDVAEHFGFNILNLVETKSRRDYNKYKIEYPEIFSISELKPYLYIETVYSVKAFPTEGKQASCIIVDFMKDRGLTDMVTQYDLEPFDVRVQSLDRTFVDKVFAICDYYIDSRIREHSRHLYDIYKLYPKIDFDNVLVELVKETREVRKNNPLCLSAQEGYNINELLEKIILEETYKSDYKDVTEKLLYEEVSYEQVINALEMVIESEIFK